MKKIILLLSTGLMLSACGQSESEQLTQEKNNLKKEIKTAENKLDDEKTKHVSKSNTLTRIEGELKQAKGGNAVSNDEYTQNIKDYTTKIGEAFKNYTAIENKIDAKKDSELEDQLTEVTTNIKDAIKSYETPFKDANPPQSFEEIHKQIESANKLMKSGSEKLEKGYDKQDKTLISEGKEALQKAINAFNNIQIK